MGAPIIYDYNFCRLRAPSYFVSLETEEVGAALILAALLDRQIFISSDRSSYSVLLLVCSCCCPDDPDNSDDPDDPDDPVAVAVAVAVAVFNNHVAEFFLKNS